MPSFNGDLSKWDVSKVTNMGYMFISASSFNADISKWDVSKVTRMESMFFAASSFNRDISKWDVSRVKNMDQMFSLAVSFEQTLCGKWQTSETALEATYFGMFDGSPGRICTTTTTSR